MAPRPIIVHRVNQPASARIAPGPMEKFNSNWALNLSVALVAYLHVPHPSEPADSFPVLWSCPTSGSARKALGRFRRHSWLIQQSPPKWTNNRGSGES